MTSKERNQETVCDGMKSRCTKKLRGNMKIKKDDISIYSKQRNIKRRKNETYEKKLVNLIKHGNLQQWMI